MSGISATEISTAIAQELPYLRRYARALTGSQESGDRYAMATLESILTEDVAIRTASSPKIGLYKCFHSVWSSAGAPLETSENPLIARAQQHMSSLTPNSREVLLLHAIEGFELNNVAEIMDRDLQDVTLLLDAAIREMEESVTGKVMVIEDEAIIAMDIVDIVSDIGHKVTGIARTRREAVELASREKPDLILSDIQLADDSSGIDAVNDILRSLKDLPVIFITAFPERLLTGERPEPAFLITKPFNEEQVRSAVSQAMFFASTEPLRV